MARTAGDIIERVRNTLVDPAPGVAFLDAELYDYLSAALSAVVAVKSDAYRRFVSVPLVAGYVQTLPEDGLALLDILANTGGRAVNQVGRELLTSGHPDWTAATPRAAAREWMADSRDPQRFYVNPPNDGTGALDVLYGAVPMPVSSPSEWIQVSDAYENALWAFTLSLAYAANTKRQDLVKSQQMTQLFGTLMGLRAQTQVAVSPKLDAGETT